MKTVVIIAFYLVAFLVTFYSKRIIPNNRIRVPIVVFIGIIVSLHIIGGAMEYMMSDRPKSLKGEEWPINITARPFFEKKSGRRDTLIGMTKREVINLLGLPSDTLELLREPADTLVEDYIYYTGDHKGVVLDFKRGKVIDSYQIND